ncbi:hypothetical protein QQ045_032097 [Rhodiola kirilowii]
MMLDPLTSYVSQIAKVVKTSIKRQHTAPNKIKSSKRSSSERTKPSYSPSNSSFSAVEVSTQLKHVFKFIDRDQDGRISASELEEVMLCLGHDKSTSAKEAEDVVRQLEKNNDDGFIDMDVFMDIVEGKCSIDEEQHLLDAFRLFDTDENGFISAKELLKVMKRIAVDQCVSLEECVQMIKGVDQDGDGLVDFEEFKLMMIGGGAK